MDTQRERTLKLASVIKTDMICADTHKESIQILADALLKFHEDESELIRDTVALKEDSIRMYKEKIKALEISEGTSLDRVEYLKSDAKAYREKIKALEAELSGLGGPRGAQFRRVEMQQEMIKDLEGREKLWRQDFPVGWEATHRRMKEKVEGLEAIIKRKNTILKERTENSILFGNEQFNQIESLKAQNQELVDFVLYVRNYSFYDHGLPKTMHHINAKAEALIQALAKNKEETTK